MSLAWHAAALYRVKQMPKLEELVGVAKSPQRPTQQSIEDMRSTAIMLTRLYGGTVTRRSA
jgi:hypothetical protein